MEEKWKDIKGCLGYQVSNFGNVKSLDRKIKRVAKIKPDGTIIIYPSCAFACKYEQLNDRTLRSRIEHKSRIGDILWEYLD